MICVHCGKEIQDGMAFCPYCGKSAAAKAPKLHPGKPSRKTAAVGAAAALLLVGGIAAANHKPTIDLDRYLTVTASGYDTIGTLDVSLDTEKLEADYGKKIAASFQKALKKDKGAQYNIDSDYTGSGFSLFVSECASGSADKTDHLHNGDVVTYTWDEMADEAQDLFGVKVKYSDMRYTIAGLTEVELFDAMENVEVEISGVSPYGTAYAEVPDDDPMLDDLEYEFDQDMYLSNGDTVTLTIHSAKEDYSDFVEKYGKLPAQTEYTYTVEGLDEYVTDASKLSDSVLGSLRAKAETKMQRHVDNDWDAAHVTYKGMDYLGNYILTPKDDGMGGSVADVVLADYTKPGSEEHFATDTSYYWYITFRNVSRDADGVLTSDPADNTSPKNKFMVRSGIEIRTLFQSGEQAWYFYGFGSYDEMYASAVAARADKYNCQNNVNAL